ncbi:MAG TPA: penicillin-binding transpeptidase domain-containing protein, partial [Planctomycetaceae bacterium]|nr:penicillin-binding transpeptidase domain-containing protein [Planctomycetaceae bacterium]
RLREGMDRVVNWQRGTGYKYVHLPDIRIAGKTGTAEVGGIKPDHAWFAGYVPAENPKYAFAIALEHGGSGGQSAGPLAKQLVQAMLDEGLLERSTVVKK